MDLNELRTEIDKIDTELVRLFTQRMDISAQVADYKKATSFEAVIGYVYLLGQFDRLQMFFEILSKDFLGDKK